MASILVIGSSGTIGCPLVRGLRKRKHEVVTADTRHGEEPSHFRCDVSKYRQVEKLFGNGSFEYVYNLAAEFGRKNGEDYYEQLWETNVIGLKNILRLQEQKKFRLIHFSSSEIYGELKTKDGFLKEEFSEQLPLKQNNDYAISKWVNELQIRNSMATKQTETLIVRLFNAYGPGEYFTPYRSVVTQFVYKALHNLPYEVYLNYYRVFMYIDDLISTLCNIVDRFKPRETYNIGGEEYVEVKKVSDMILNYLNKDDSLVEYLDVDVHNVVSKRPDITKAKRDLEHKPTIPLSVGIPKTIEWHKQIYC
ncbi:MAG: NAD(P)-dependent oxidoreductase [Candidatus Bathyarchaeota archaeon]|nr:MAG: NAD(P)-dependent oxidoreductase [Candidatus Bathyarchaeota archaeon]